MKFTELNLDDCVLQALDTMNFQECTPVQEHTIPVILEGKDLIGVAQTGTGKTATPEQAQEIHAFIRSIVANKYGKEIADNTSILYGGSCKPSNAKELFSNPDVDGGLIGGAALKVSDFKGIIDAFNA